MRLSHLIEPQLEFGQKMRHVDSRHGLIDNGPFDAGLDGAPTRIRVGVVGSAQTVEGTVRWIDRCTAGIEATTSGQPNLFPRFPGLGADSPFRSEFVTAEELQRTIPPREIARLMAIEGQAEVTRAIVDSIVGEIESLAERTVPPSVVLVALPIGFIQRTVNARAAVADGETAEEPEATDARPAQGRLHAIADPDPDSVAHHL